MTQHLRCFAALTLLSAGVAACSIDGSSMPGPIPSGAVRGELAVYSATFADGTSELQYFLRVMGDVHDERRLLFSANPDLVSGEWLDVWGQDDGKQILVDHFAPVASVTEPEPSWHSLITADPYKTRTIAFVLVDLGDGVNLTNETALTRVMGTEAADESVRQFFIENSFGRQDVDGQVFGPLETTMSACETSSIPTALRPQIPGTFDQYFWYLGSKVADCSWSGLAMVGSPDRPARDTWFNASSSCTVLVHEPGHNLGMKHASLIKCGTEVFVDEPDGVCTHSEYGDSLDAMGSGCRHMSSYTKTYQEWFGGCNMVDVPSTGTFTLLPLEVPCDGIQGLQIKMPKTRPFYRSGGGGTAGTTNLTHYYVEFRGPYGFDGAHGRTSALKPQVQIRVSGDIRRRTQSGLNTWYLDMVPSTSALDGLSAGESFTDPAGGITITVDAIDTTMATVSVDIADGTGSPTCMDGVTTVTSPGPGPESCAAGPAVPGDAPIASDAGLLPAELPADAGRSRDTARRDTASDAASDGVSGGALGTGGASGTVGAGGRNGSGGAGGSSSRTGGTSGTGSGGSVSSGGGVGSGGSVSSGGSARLGSSQNSGGNSGAGGSQSSGGGAGGMNGGEGGGPTTQAASDSSGGCSCAHAGQGGSRAGGVLAGLLFLALAFMRTRRQRSRG